MGANHKPVHLTKQGSEVTRTSRQSLTCPSAFHVFFKAGESKAIVIQASLGETAANYGLEK